MAEPLQQEPLEDVPETEAPPARIYGFPGSRDDERAARRAFGRALAWARRHALDAGILTALLSTAGVVHAWGMARYPAFVDDEGTYVSQAWAVLKLHALAPYTYWYDHPPLGWLLLAAWGRVMPLFGPGQYAVAAARTFMLVLLLAAAFFVYAIALRLGLRRPFAALAVLLFTLSPVAVHYQRMVLLDNVGVVWLLAALLLALTPKRHLAAYAGAGVCLAAAVLTKETFVLFAPAVVLAVWETSRTASRRFALAVFATLFVLVASFYPLFALLRGEFLQGAAHTSLLNGVRYQLTRPGTGSVFTAGSETRAIVRSWFATDPFVFIAAAMVPLGLAVRRLRPAAVGLVFPLLPLLRPGGYLPAMFVIGLLPFAALVAAGAADWALQPSRLAWLRRRRSAIAARVYLAGGERRRRAGGLLAAALAAALLAAFVVAATPRWAAADRHAMTADAAAPSREAVAWLSAHASRRAYLLVDDSVWTDLVNRGFARSHVIWFSKLDLDPSLGGTRWNRFTYVVRSNLIPFSDWGPNAQTVWRHGSTAAVFRYGGEWVTIRRVGRPTTLPSGAPAP